MPSPEGFIESFSNSSRKANERHSAFLASEEIPNNHDPNTLADRYPEIAYNAKRTHEARFEPLQAVLTNLRPEITRFRHGYFPDSPIFIANRYEKPFSSKSAQDVPKDYYSAMMILNRHRVEERPLELIAVYAMAKERVRKKMFGRSELPEIHYSLGVALHHVDPGILEQSSYDPKQIFLKKALEVERDFASITPPEELYSLGICLDSRGEFEPVKHFGTVFAEAPSALFLSDEIKIFPISTKQQQMRMLAEELSNIAENAALTRAPQSRYRAL